MTRQKVNQSKLPPQIESTTENDPQKELAISFAKIQLESITSAALTIHHIHGEQTDLTTLIQQFDKQMQKFAEGDMGSVEYMLMTQARTLNVIFHDMIIKMARSEILPHFQTYADIGLKAQNQSRQTLAVLAELKNPKRATFIKQQNNAVNQQVNPNFQSENSKKSVNPANELLSIEVQNETMDIRGTIAPSQINPELETVEIRGRKNTRRKGDQ